MPSEKSKLSEGRPVLVTTEHRGVFFGYEESRPTETSIKLRRARNCLYWDAATKGFLGLTTTGPTTGCRIGPAVASIELLKVTSISDVEPAAVDAWERAPWSR